jgi:hypothetical protein
MPVISAGGDPAGPGDQWISAFKKDDGGAWR